MGRCFLSARCAGCRSAAAPIEFWVEKPEGLIRSVFRFCLWCFLAFKKKGGKK